MKASPIINSFVAGELSPRLAGRTDINQYYQSAAELLNMLVEFYGGAKKAPGTYFVSEVKTSSLSTRLIRFVFSDTQAYIIEVGNLYMRFYKDDATTGKGGAILETHKDISDIVVATGVITATSHGFSNGDEVYINEIAGTTELNGKRYLVADVTTHTFTLTDIDGNPIDTTEYTAYVSGGEVSRVYTLTTTYTTADIWNLQFSQTADILYITLGKSDDAAKGRPQAKLTRTAHASWTLTDIDYSTGEARPALMPSNITATQLKSDKDTGSGATITADVAVFDITHEGSIWRLQEGYIKITDVASGGLKTTATADILYGGDLNNSATYTTDWAEGAWSGYRGYPRSVTISEGRLIYGYTVSQPQTNWGSAIGAYDTFELGSDDSDAIEFTADTNEVEIINWLFPASEILLGTPSGVSSLGTGSDTLALTATTGRVKKKSKDGTSLISPQQIGSYVYYWQKYNRILREYGLSPDTLDYETKDATAISEHISESGIVDMAYQQSPYSILWCVRADGKLAALTRQIEQKVTAWTLHDTQGFYESVAVIPKESYDEVWFVVRRTINGVTRRYIEYMVAPEFESLEDCFFLHSGLTYDNPKEITNITKANPVKVTCANDFSEGDIVKISGLVARTVGDIPEKTIDAIEYPSDSLAQAAYISSAPSGEGEEVNQSNTSYGEDGIDLGKTAGSEIRIPAQSFKLQNPLVISAVEVGLLNINASPSGNWTLRIETDNGGKPSGTLANANASVEVTPPSPGNTIKGTFATGFYLETNVTYWLVINSVDEQDPDDLWRLMRSASDKYSYGDAAQSKNGVWTVFSTVDLYFKIYTVPLNLQCSSESTIKTYGNFSLRTVAAKTNSLNETLTKTLSTPLDWTDVQAIRLDIRASRTGSNIKISFHDSGGETIEHTPNILIADDWQQEIIDISEVANTDKSSIDSIIITITNSDEENIIYLDNIFTLPVIKEIEIIGMTELNDNKYIISEVTGTDFCLRDLYGNSVDGTEYTAYDTGGEVRKCVNEVSGLEHLILQNVQVFADGEYHPDRTVSADGKVTLNGYYAQTSIGLGYTARLKTNDLEGIPGGVTSQGRTKRVTEIKANLYKSLDFKAGTDLKKDSISVRDVALPASQKTPLFTGIKKIPFPSGWDTKKQVIIEQEKCLPLHILSIVAEMEVN
ncbi:MAG: ubiquitin-activating E1 FCCH domain-containing protein [Candidatus Omnitrophota bacterium]|jgi:hypothetical protein